MNNSFLGIQLEIAADLFNSVVTKNIYNSKIRQAL